jgi:hypothetical protein
MDCKDKVLSNEYYDIITDFPVREENIEGYDLCYSSIDDIYNMIYINRMGLPPILSNFYDYQNIPNLYGLMDISSTISSLQAGNAVFDPNDLYKSGILQVQRAPLNLTGRGCVICIIDTGINYADEVFLDENKKSRVLAIWDQTIQEGTPPEGFLYGTEYVQEDINRALESDTPYAVVPSRDTDGHGSAMAAVAAGSILGGGYGYIGAAPDAGIVVVKLKEAKRYLREFYHVPQNIPAYQENDIMLAVQYAESFADTFRRPVIICLGVGTNMGDHSGNSPLSRYLSIIASKRSRAVVICGGNEGNSAHHYQGTLAMRQDGDSSSVDVEIRVGDNCSGFYMEMWGTVPDVYNISMRSPGGETVPPLRLSVSQTLTYSFIYEKSRVTISSSLIEPASGEQLIRFRVTEPTAGIWVLNVFSVGEVHNGNFNIWLPINEFLDSELYFLRPSPYITLTEPALADDCIGVSTYNASNDSFYTESGRGFGNDGILRPSFAAPGVNVPLPRGNATGSSIAAALTAGATAQFMQWAVVEGNNVNAETREVKNYLIRGASRDANLIYPNREWGYGRLNMMGAFDALTNV